MKRFKLNLPVVLLLAAVLLVTFVRIRLLTVPLERDEGEYAYGGQLILQGVPPYAQFYNMKFPGIYAGYAVLMALFGQTPAGIHFGLLLVNAAAVFLLYKLARRFLDAAGAAVTAAAYVLLSASPVVLGLAAHATQFVVVFTLAGLLLLLSAEDSGQPALFLGGGVLLALSCLMKQPGALFGLFGFCLLLAKRNWRNLAWYCLGGAIPFVLTALILWQAGVFKRFWFWTITYAGVHGSEIPWTEGMANLARFLRSLPMTADGLFWILAAAGFVCVVLRKSDRNKMWLAGFLIASMVAVTLSYNFSTHYFVMLLPALCLLTGYAVNSAVQRIGPKAAGVVFVVLWSAALFHHREIFFELSPDEVCKKIYRANPFIECREIARYIAGHSVPDARVAVLGSEPELPFYAHRRSATSYIYMYDLIEDQPYAEEMQREMIAQIEAARPEYLIFVRIPASWDLRANFQRTAGSTVMAWSSRYAQMNYEPAGLVVVKPQSEFYWGKDAMNGPPPRDLFISVLKRK